MLDAGAHRRVAMVKKATLFVEGGGDQNKSVVKCRNDFQAFIKKSGFRGKMPRIIPCGSRNIAFERYQRAVLKGEMAFLLVDSEGPVHVDCLKGVPKDWSPWTHLKYGSGDGWDKPRSEPEENCHLMVECMECWILVDRSTLASFFGKGFRENALPPPPKNRPPELIGKAEALEALEMATRGCGKKGRYSKGKHSFDLLAKIDSGMVVATCPWAARFIEQLEEKMKG